MRDGRAAMPDQIYWDVMTGIWIFIFNPSDKFLRLCHTECRCSIRDKARMLIGKFSFDTPGRDQFTISHKRLKAKQ
jgi:hypothetical protein